MVVPPNVGASAIGAKFRGSPSAESVFGKTMHHAYRDSDYRAYSDKTASDFFADTTCGEKEAQYRAATAEVDAYHASELLETKCDCKKIEAEEAAAAAAKAQAEAQAQGAAAAPGGTS
jgi:hypothetical protein